jgi:hypothetical protein
LKIHNLRIRQVCRLLIKSTGSLALAGFIWMGLIQDNQVRNSPQFPDVASGRIYPKSIHGGSYFYLTKAQKDHCDHVTYVTLAVFGFCVLLLIVDRNIWYMDPDYEKSKT